MTTLDYKRLGLIGAAVTSTLLFWGAAKPWLSSPLKFEDWTVVLWPSLAVIVMGAVVGLALALLKSRWERVALILASWATFLIFYEPSLWYVSILPIFFLLWYDAARRMQDDLSDRARLRINATLGRALKFVLLGGFLMISMAFYLYVVREQPGAQAVSRAVTAGASLVYDNTKFAEELEQLPQFVQGGAKQFFVSQVDARVREWLGPWAFVAPPVLAFTLFFALWAVSFIFREFSIWLGTALFGILRRTGFVKVRTDQVQAEHLSL